MTSYSYWNHFFLHFVCFHFSWCPPSSYKCFFCFLFFNFSCKIACVISLCWDIAFYEETNKHLRHLRVSSDFLWALEEFVLGCRVGCRRRSSSNNWILTLHLHVVDFCWKKKKNSWLVKFLCFTSHVFFWFFFRQFTFFRGNWISSIPQISI